MTYDLGDDVPLRHKVYDDGTLTAATVTLTVTAPNGTTSTPAVTTPSTGIYQATAPTTQTGLWTYVWSVSGTVPHDLVPGSFAVANPAPLAYATLDELKERLKVTAVQVGVDGLTDDGTLQDKLVTASRDIDTDCGRPHGFWLDPAPVQRIFNVARRVVPTRDGYKLLIDDIGDLFGLIVELGCGFEWTPLVDYETGPDNALLDGRAIEWLLRPYQPWTASPRQRVRITARWGWPAIPNQIKEACLIRAHRLCRRPDSPEGIAGSSAFGPIRVSRWDPDYTKLISDFVKPAIA